MSEKITAKSPLRVELSDKLRSTLAGVLNRLHGCRLSDRFWGLILESYVKTAITRKQLLAEKNIQFNIPVLPMSSHHFPRKKEIFREQLKGLVRHWQTRGAAKEIFRMVQTQDRFRIGFHEFPGIEDFKDELGLSLPLHHPFLIGKINRRLRKKLAVIAETEQDMYIRNAILNLPQVYIEYFKQLYSSIPLYKPESKEFHVHNMRTCFDELLVAKYAEQGAKVVWYQHGSHYGEYKWEYYHHYEHLMADEFRTWGWQIAEKDTPWKAYRLEAFKRTYREFDNSGEYSLMLCYPKMYSTYRKSCVEATNHLEQNLDTQKFPLILARPRPLHKKHGHEDELSFISGGAITIGNGLEPMAKQVSRCRLVVQINVPSTNFLECIYVDHPVTGILKNTDPTEVITPFYSFFLENGVLHQDVQSLVQFLNTTNLEPWWSEVTESDMYSQFKEKFTANAAPGKKG